jgi:hypothetical protein
MKRLFIILLIIFFAMPCFANQIIIGKKKAAPACTLLESPIQTTYSSSAILGGDTAASQYLAIKFTAPSDLTLRTVVLYMATDNNSPTENVVVALCTDNAGAPNVCTNADSVMSSPGVAGYKYLRWSEGYEITNATVYHIRIYTAQDSNTNYYNLGYNNAVDGQQLKKSGDGTTWSDYNGDNSAQGFFELSECVTYVH